MPPDGLRSNVPGGRLETAQLRGHAASLGFELFGVAPADPLAAADFYARWVALGHAGEMGYLERAMDRRRDPRRLIPGAESVICLGMHYPAIPPPAPAATAPAGRLASYALGDDYHDILSDRARQLLEFLRQQIDPHVEGRCFVDTAPVLERELAQLAGLGWWGKNTCLINKRRGSTFFLAEIILTTRLALDEPATDHCGSCTRCLDACPTDAFPAAYELDARRCISYLTIELRGPIPRHLRAPMGNWIFGCDVCQQVCPWNRAVPTPVVPELSRRMELATPDLVQLLQLDEEGFRQRFRRHPVKRAKRKGLLRNVAVALGNVGGVAQVPVLSRVLQEEVEPLVRRHVAWALGHIGGPEAQVALRQARPLETDTEVVEEIDAALAVTQSLD